MKFIIMMVLLGVMEILLILSTIPHWLSGREAGTIMMFMIPPWMLIYFVMLFLERKK